MRGLGTDFIPTPFRGAVQLAKETVFAIKWLTFLCGLSHVISNILLAMH